MTSTIHDYYAASPFPLGAFASRTAGSMPDFCKDLGLSIPAARQWASKKLVPWKVYEAAIRKYGPMGFTVPEKTKRNRPFRLPAHLEIVVESQPAPAPPAPIPQNIPDLLLALATQMDSERRELCALYERVTALEQRMPVVAAPKQVTSDIPRPMMVAEPKISPKPTKPTLEQAIRARNGSAKDWLVTNRAEHDFANLAADDQKRSLDLIERILGKDDWRAVGASKVPENVAKHFRTKDAWAFRVGKQRLLVAREGPYRRILAVASRSDKTIFSSEL